MSDLKAAVIDFQQALLKKRIASKFAERFGMEHPSDDARKQYLKDHPNADPKNHTVKKTDGGGGGGDSRATAPLVSQMSSMVKKITDFDAGASKKELKKHVDEIDALGRKLEKQLEKLDGKIEGGKLNRAIEHAMAVSSYSDKLMEAAGNPVKVDKLLGDVQAELNSAMKLLR